MAHEDLANYFETNFAMMQFHNYSLTELESLLPWERQVYVSMLNSHIKEENNKIKLRRQGFSV